MNFESENPDGARIYTNIDLTNRNSVIFFKEFLGGEFAFGEEIIFSCFRKESLTDIRELMSIENDLMNMFNSENLYIIDFLDESRFYFLYRHVFDLNSPNLIVKLWKYFYSLSFFVLNKGYSFNDAKVYFKNHEKRDVHLKSFLRGGLADVAYIKGLGGDILIKQSIF